MIGVSPPELSLNPAQISLARGRFPMSSFPMTLTDPQKEQLAGWLAEGLSLSDIQKNVTSEFGINITYMDLRFLIDDLELEIKDNTPKPEDDESEEDGSGGEDSAEDADAEVVGGAVNVDVDAVQRPGAMASGNVTFSDGQSLGWQLDQYGRLGLIPGADTPDGYQPPEEDVAEFQEQLQSKLRGPGM